MKPLLTLVLLHLSILLIAQNWIYYDILNTTKDQAANSIKDLEVDNKGNVWTANHYGGASLYDGQQFTNFTMRNGLAEEDILDITIDNSDRVFLLGYSTITIYNQGSFSSIQLPSTGIPHQIQTDRLGRIWVSTTSMMYYFENNTWKSIDIARTFNLGYSLEINDMDVDSANNVWLATTSGLIKISDQSYQLFNTLDGMIDNRAIDVECPKNKPIYFAYAYSGFGTFDGSNFTTYSSGDGRTDYPQRKFTVATDGSLYFVNRFYGLIHYDLISNQLEVFPDTLIKSYWTEWAITRDNEDKIWVGTNKGLTKYFNNQFTHFTKTTGLASNHINTIYFDANDNPYVGTWNGLSSLKNDQWSYLGVGNVQDIIGELDGDLLCTMNDTGFIKVSPTIPNLRQKLANLKYGNKGKNVKDNDGIYWLPTTKHSVLRFDGKDVTEMLLDPFDKNTRLQEVALNPINNTVYAATLNGIFKFDQTKFVPVNGLNSVWCRDIAFTSKGDLILLMRNAAYFLDIFRYDKNNVLSNFSGLNIEDNGGLISFHYLFVDSKDRIWFGYEKGLYKFEAGVWTHYTTQNGLLSDKVSCIEEDSKSNIWIGTYSGICVLLDEATNSSNVLKNQNEVEVFPNPCSDYIHFNIKNKDLQNNSTIEIFDVLSNKIYSEESISLPINCSSWMNGAYFYRIISNEKILDRGKFLKI